MKLRKKRLISICLACSPLLLWCALAPHPYFRTYYLKGEIQKFTQRLKGKDTSYLRGSRGHAHQMNGNYEKAITDYTTAIQMVPGRRDVRWNRGQCYLALGRMDEAKSDAKALGRNIAELQDSPIQPISHISPFDGKIFGFTHRRRR